MVQSPAGIAPDVSNTRLTMHLGAMRLAYCPTLLLRWILIPIILSTMAHQNTSHFLKRRDQIASLHYTLSSA